MLDITLEQLQVFSDRSGTLLTVDAPLFGILTIMHGRVLVRGAHEANKVGASMGFPPHDQIIAEASRFWIQHGSGVRERKTREQMAHLLREAHRAVAT
jgi:predicted GNAT superfamily acetyltransferase